MKKRYSTSLVICAFIASGCTTTMEKPSAPFGTSVKQNIAAQTVAPTPEQKQNTYIKPDQERMNKARIRYRADDVEKPRDLNTTNEEQ